MIPIQIRDSEEAALKLLKPAMESALHEANIELEIPTTYTGVRGFFDHNLKINKLAYAAIEEYDLPLLRTWYKYGQYEPYEEIRPTSLEIGDNSNNAYVPSHLKTDVTQKRIKDYLLEQNLPAIFEKDLYEFLIDNYKDWDPAPYTNTYIASTKIIRVLEELASNDEEEITSNIGELNEEFKQASIDLRYDLDNIDTFNENVQEHVKKYLLNLEDALLQIDETSEINQEQLETLEESRNVYHQYVWPWAALKISLDKAKGPESSLENFDSSGRDILLSNKKSYQIHVMGWETELSNQGLKPAFAKQQSQTTTPEAVRKLQRAALENN